MRVSVPDDTELLTRQSSGDEYLSAIESFGISPIRDSAEQIEVRTSTDTRSHNNTLDETYLYQKKISHSKMADHDMNIDSSSSPHPESHDTEETTMMSSL
ncbi:hypothetical protein K3495_g13546 [Podosphaera aphanis]|nr:hypothetical protein K3495_g13546 [Podosphaera aphanis]